MWSPTTKNHRQLIRVVERKGLADWDPRDQHARGRPLPSYRKEKGRKGLTTYSETITRHGSTVC